MSKATSQNGTLADKHGCVVLRNVSVCRGCGRYVVGGHQLATGWKEEA